MNGEMIVTVGQQSSGLLWAVCAGFLMGVYYDCFRALRLIFKCGKTAVIIQDLLFWISSAVIIFFVSIAVNGGYVRIYFILAVLLSWGLYFFTLGHAVMFMVNIVVIGIKRVIGLVFKWLIRPVTRGADRFFMLISQKISGLLTYVTKNTKNHKKC